MNNSNNENEEIFPLLENEDEILIEGQKVRSKGIYLLPNLFTTGALCAGFYSIISSNENNFFIASVCIFIAMFLDGCDGRIARLTNTQSDFGEEYDSLADVISFGVAPAILAYNWKLKELGNLGIICASLYVCCSAIRLARFNVQTNNVDKKYFIGLASPAAAGVLASIVWFFLNSQTNQIMYNLSLGIFAFITILTGISMITAIKYISGKSLNLKEKIPFVGLILIMFACALFFIHTSTFLMFLFITYAFSGPIIHLTKFIKKKE